MKMEGYRVIDLSQFLPGPHLTMILADHGADVIKVENTGEGEPTRHIGLKKGKETVYFRNTQRGKRSLTLDLKSEEGREILLKLAETADILVESFRPGVMKRLGLDYETVRKRAPRIIYASMSAFGQEGRYAQHPAHDMAVQSYAGMFSLNQDRSGRPVHANMPSADMLNSQMTLNGILMALLRREKTGRGDYVDCAMYDCVVSWSANVTGPVFAEGRSPEPASERTLGGAAFYQIYETKDHRYITLGGSEIKFATNLLDALGRPDLIDLCKQPPGPVQMPVQKFLEETFLTRTMDEWEAWFEDKDVCFGPVRTLHEAYQHPFMQEREMLLFDEQGLEHIGLPIKYRDEPGRVSFQVPEHGQHSEQILADLGYGGEAVKALKDKGVW